MTSFGGGHHHGELATMANSPDLKQASVVRRAPRIGQLVRVHTAIHLGKLVKIEIPIFELIGYDPGSDRWQIVLARDNSQYGQTVMVTQSMGQSEDATWLLVPDQDTVGKPLVQSTDPFAL